MEAIVGLAAILFVLWLLAGQSRTQTKAAVSAPPVRPSTPKPVAVAKQLPSRPAIDLKDLPPDMVRMVEGLPRRSLEELQQQWLTTIGLIDRVGPSKSAHFIVFRDAIGHDWARRLTIAEQDPKAFPWPTTKAQQGKNGLDSSDWHLIGMLSYPGYRVGTTNGVSTGVRQQILDACFAASLPPING